MTTLEFCKKWQGKKADWDGKFGAQCVDLARWYNHEVNKIEQTPPLGDGGAKDIWEKCGVMKKRPAGEMYRGDMLIYGATDTNMFGHVCILIEAYDKDNLLVFEQDGFAQDGAKYKLRDSRNLLGALYVDKKSA